MHTNIFSIATNSNYFGPKNSGRTKWSILKLWFLQLSEDHYKWCTTTLDPLTSILPTAQATNTVLKGNFTKSMLRISPNKNAFFMQMQLNFGNFVATFNILNFCSQNHKSKSTIGSKFHRIFFSQYWLRHLVVKKTYCSSGL